MFRKRSKRPFFKSILYVALSHLRGQKNRYFTVLFCVQFQWEDCFAGLSRIKSSLVKFFLDGIAKSLKMKGISVKYFN